MFWTIGKHGKFMFISQHVYSSRLHPRIQSMSKEAVLFNGWKTNREILLELVIRAGLSRIHIEGSQLRWFRHLFLMHPALSREVFWTCLTGRVENAAEIISLSLFLEMSWHFPRRAGGGGWEKGSLGISSPNTQTQISIKNGGDR